MKVESFFKATKALGIILGLGIILASGFGIGKHFAAKSTPTPNTETELPIGNIHKYVHPVNWPDDKKKVLEAALYGWNVRLGFQYFYWGYDNMADTVYALYPLKKFLGNSYDGLQMQEEHGLQFVIVNADVDNNRLLAICYHEFGHVMGLDHVKTKGSIMTTNGDAPEPSNDDTINAKHALGLDK